MFGFMKPRAKTYRKKRVVRRHKRTTYKKRPACKTLKRVGCKKTSRCTYVSGRKRKYCRKKTNRRRRR